MNTHEDDQHSENSITSDDEWLQRALKESSNTYLMDDGFTAHVTRSLPSKQALAWRRPLILGIGAIAGLSFAAFIAGPELTTRSLEAYQLVSTWLPHSYLTSLQSSTIVALLFSSLISWLLWRRTTH